MSVAIFKDVVLPAGEEITHSATGNTIVLSEATANLQLSVNGGSFAHFAPGFHWKPFPQDQDGNFADIVTRVSVKNPTAGAVTYTLAVALGDLVDRALTLSGGTVPTAATGGTLSDEADVSVAAAATPQVATATAGRRKVILVSLPTNPGAVRVGSSSAGAARGAYLAPGQSISLETVSDVYIHNPNAAACVFTRSYIA